MTKARHPYLMGVPGLSFRRGRRNGVRPTILDHDERPGREVPGPGRLSGRQNGGAPTALAVFAHP